MAKKKSHDPNFKVAKTVGSAAEGEDSLLSLNNIIQQATTTAEIFEPMKRLCAALAVHRKLILPGMSKIREGGSPDDFLNFATLHYIDRWNKQKEPPHGKRPVAHIHNWIPYISSTIRFCLMHYNKEVQDYDFLPVPTYYSEAEGGEELVNDVFSEDDQFAITDLKTSITIETIHQLIESLPKELSPYKADILYYINNQSKKFVDVKRKNFVIIGKNLFCRRLEEWVA